MPLRVARYPWGNYFKDLMIFGEKHVANISLLSSQAVQVDNLVYVSGTLGMDVNGTMMTGIANQTRMALDNIGHVLREAQSGFDKGEEVIKENVWRK